jgi:hypothetical protein
MRNTWRLCLVLLSTVIPTIAHAQDHSTGLQFIDPEKYALIPKAKEPVTGTGVGKDKEIIPDSYTLENFMPTAQKQDPTSNDCAAFAVTSNKAYRIYKAAGQRGSPNDYLQSPSFPYSAVCQRRSIIKNGRCVAESTISDELDFLNEIGSLPLKEMPYRPNTFEDWSGHISESRNKSSVPYTALPSAPHGDTALKMMKNLIAGGNPVIVAIKACKEFYYPVNGYIKDVDRSDFKCSGHAVLVVGYDSRLGLVRILNSWGDKDQWRGSDDGKVWMSEKVFLARYVEGYIDQGPGQVQWFPGPYTVLALNQAPSIGPTSTPTAVGASAPPIQEEQPSVITPDILKAAVRLNIGPRVGTNTIIDPDDGTEHTVNKRYLWLNLPDQYADQVKSVTFRLKHPSFRHPYKVIKKESSIFMVGWIGYNCVDEASVTATLTDPSLNGGKPVEADFDYCKVDDTAKPIEE